MLRLPAWPCLWLTCIALLSGCAVDRSHGPAIDTIAFASCAKPGVDQTIWYSIVESKPDCFLFIGDNVYVDQPRPPKGPEDFERTYAGLAAQPGWQALRRAVPVYATWDDHDYGLNDAGKEFPLKQVAQQQFIQFFDLPSDSPVRQREGVYDAHTFGPIGQRVQIILLDTRYFRDALMKNPQGRPKGKGPYVPRTDGKGTMLGDAQWTWLKQQLTEPADLRIIASSIQVIADERGSEAWGNLPHERQRLYDLIRDTNANGVVFISGDRHLTEASLDDDPRLPYPMWDFTNSDMNKTPRPHHEDNVHRQGGLFAQANFGLLRVEWDAPQPRLIYQSCDLNGEMLNTQSVLLSDLRVDGQH